MSKQLFFTSRLDFKSGWGTLTINYINEFEKKDVIVFCNKKNSTFGYKQYEILREPLDYVKNPFLIFIDYFKIKNILSKYSTYKIYSHFPVEPYCLFLPLISKFFYSNIFYAIGTYSLELDENYRTKFLFYLAKKKFQNIIFFSSFTKNNIERKIRFNYTKFKKIINPTIIIKSNKQQKKFEKKTIICVGEIKPRKGYHYLIEVLVRINRYYKKNFNLILIGKSNNSNYQDRLNLIVKKNYQSKNVKFLTNISEEKLKFYYQKSHLFTMLSKKIGNHFEGFGIVYLEALSFGLPILVSKESGGKDLSNINKNIKTFNPKKIDNIAKEIIKITNNTKLMSFNYNFNILKDHNNTNKLKLKKFYKTLN